MILFNVYEIVFTLQCFKASLKSLFFIDSFAALREFFAWSFLSAILGVELEIFERGKTKRTVSENQPRR